MGNFVDPFSFGNGGVIFPQNEHGIRIIFEFLCQTQRDPGFIDSTQSGTGGIHTDPPDQCGISLFQHLFDDLFHTFKVIQRMLTEAETSGIRKLSFRPAGIKSHTVSDLSALVIDQKGSHAVRTEIKSDQ